MGRLITAAVALAMALPAFSAPAAEPPVADGAFVTARAGRLWLGDEEFRFLSFNVPNLHYVEDDLRFARALPFRLPDEYEIADTLESIAQIGGQVVRMYALSVRKGADPVDMPRHVLGPGRFDEAAFRALDTVLDVARRTGVRVVIPFVDNWSWWGGVAEYAAFRGKRSEAFWSDPQVIADFEGTVRFVLTRVNTRTGVAYRDDPAILAWETGNELHAPQEWTRRIAAAIKRLDPNHLVIDGRQAEVLDRESIAEPGIDLLQTHHYEKSAQEVIAHVRAGAALARGRKPYHVGEVGFLDTAAMTAVMDAVIAEGLSGALVWSLRGHDRDGGFYWHQEPSGGDVFKAYHWPGFASGEAYDETRLLRELRRRAFAIRGMAEPILERPAAPRIIAVTDGGMITWRGSAGAGAYAVERRDSAAAPWRVIAGEVSDAAVQYRPLLCDETATPGHGYTYRVTARNEAGPSPPSPAVGPVLVTHRTLIDELEDASRMTRTEGELEFSRSRARTVKEDAHTVAGERGAAFVYRCEAAISGARVWAFAEKAGDHLAFSASADGERFAPLTPQVEVFAAGDAATYGYWLPVAYRLVDPPAGTRYVRIELRGAGVRVSRVELDHGEEKAVNAATLREVIEGELRSDLLPFWRERGPDTVRGGFIAEMANDGTLRPEAAKGLVLNARLLWTYSALYRRLHDPRDLELARRAYAYLEASFRDRDHGGYLWRVAPDGAPYDDTKKIYGQAFCIYALAEYFLRRRRRIGAGGGTAGVRAGRAARPRRRERRLPRGAGSRLVGDRGAPARRRRPARGQVDEHSPASPRGVHQPVPRVAGRARGGPPRGAARRVRPADHRRRHRSRRRSPDQLLRRALAGAREQLHVRPRHRGGVAAGRGGRRPRRRGAAGGGAGLGGWPRARGPGRGGRRRRRARLRGPRRVGDRRQARLVVSGRGGRRVLERFPAHRRRALRDRGDAGVGVHRLADDRPRQRRVVLAGRRRRPGGRRAAEGLRVEVPLPQRSGCAWR